MCPAAFLQMAGKKSDARVAVFKKADKKDGDLRVFYSWPSMEQ